MPAGFVFQIQPSLVGRFADVSTPWLRKSLGAPVVPPQDLASRPRRNRRSSTVREAFREVRVCQSRFFQFPLIHGSSLCSSVTLCYCRRFILTSYLYLFVGAQTILTPSNFIYPIFVHDGEDDIPIESMPGQSRLGWKTGMIDKVREARAAGVNQVVVFPKTPDNLKSETAEECFNPNGLAQRSISLLKDTFPDLEVYTDVALDPYNTMGHDGMVRSDGVVMNDETVYYLCKQAVSQARAGADVISPSDMMDGRVGAIREALDAEGFTNVAIMSYTAKCVYGIFFTKPRATVSPRCLPADLSPPPCHITAI